MEHAAAPRGRIDAVVLAGGESSRMGSPKALLSLGESTFLRVICDRLQDAGVGRVVVVAGSAYGPIRDARILKSEQLVENPRPELGQLSSLQAGVRALGPSPGVLCCLVDHPLVAYETYVRMIQAWRLDPGCILLSTCNGKHGHPILIDGRFLRALLALAPEATMRAVVHENREETRDVVVDDEGIHLDCDTPEDYRRLLELFEAAGRQRR